MSENGKRCNKVVVIGGSAGGIEAVTRILSDLPEDLAAAIFVVLHLNASVPSMLPAILARKTKLHVQTPQDGLEIKCGTVYPAPPDRHLLVNKGIVHLGRGARENNFRPAVDPLFRTAAAAYGEAVIGVVLSGNLDDGTAGLLAIKRRGGTAIVQHVEDALYPGMPASALQEVPDVDHVVPVAEMSKLLKELVGRGAVAAPVEGGQLIAFDVAMGGEHPVFGEERQPEGDESKFGCPACGGVLWERREGEMVRYRCRVGHMFSDEALLAAQTENLETGLWTALRALEEAAEQATKLSSRMKSRGHERLAERFRRQANDAVRRSEIVRQALGYNQGTGDQQIPEAS